MYYRASMNPTGEGLHPETSDFSALTGLRALRGLFHIQALSSHNHVILRQS